MEDQAARRHRCTASVGLCAGQGQGVAVVLDENTRTRHHIGQCLLIRAVELECGQVGNVATQAAGRGGITHLQNTCHHPRATCVCERTGQLSFANTGLHHQARATDVVRQDPRVAAVDHEHAIVGDIARTNCTNGGTIAHLQRTHSGLIGITGAKGLGIGDVGHCIAESSRTRIGIGTCEIHAGTAVKRIHAIACTASDNGQAHRPCWSSRGEVGTQQIVGSVDRISTWATLVSQGLNVIARLLQLHKDNLGPIPWRIVVVEKLHLESRGIGCWIKAFEINASLCVIGDSSTRLLCARQPGQHFGHCGVGSNGLC